MRQIALVLCVVALVAPAFGQEAAPPSPPPPSANASSRAVLTRAEQEHFLLTARIEKVRGVKEGATGTQRATLTDGTITHDASIQPIDESVARYETAVRVEFNFRDYWGYNVAAYRLGVLLGLDMIPPSVARHHRYQAASFTWWIDDVILDEKARVAKKATPPDPKYWNAQTLILRVFDELIANTDRNQGNLLIDKHWKLWMIDHTRAFRVTDSLRNEKNILKCERSLFQKLKALTAAELKAHLDEYLTQYEQEAVLERRDLLVARIESLGPGALYDMPRR
jgi:hypothetical protein